MEIKESMDELESVNLNPVNIEKISESKKLLGRSPKFKTMYLKFEEGKKLSSSSHNGYASIFVYEGKINLKFETGEEFQLEKGSYLALDGSVKHSAVVEAPSKVVVHMCFEE